MSQASDGGIGRRWSQHWETAGSTPVSGIKKTAHLEYSKVNFFGLLGGL
jgi:hypothetical protein